MAPSAVIRSSEEVPPLNQNAPSGPAAIWPPPDNALLENKAKGSLRLILPVILLTVAFSLLMVAFSVNLVALLVFVVALLFVMMALLVMVLFGALVTATDAAASRAAGVIAMAGPEPPAATMASEHVAITRTHGRRRRAQYLA